MGSIDFSSFSDFWIRVTERGEVLECSSSLSTNLQLGDLLGEVFHWTQPKIIDSIINIEEIKKKILIFEHHGCKYRATVHGLGDSFLLVLWPILKNLKDAVGDNESFLNHPACLIADILITKDVVLKTQKKIYDLEIESTKNQLSKELELAEHREKLASLGELAAGVGHEINNPLAIILAHLEMFSEEIENHQVDLKKLEHTSNQIKSAALRIKKIVKALRSYARSGKNDQLEVIDLREPIQSILDMTTQIYHNKGIKIKTAFSDQPVYVLAEHGKIQQIIMNLLKNASDAIPESRKEKTIEIKVNSSKFGQALFSVRDNGEGIPKDIQSKIFDPFWTSKKNGEGTGLGLSLTNEFINGMKGKIDVFSEEGIYTEILISLPIVRKNNS